MLNQPKISIITVVYNGAGLIERTIKSVLAQTYPNIEYIIIDGASSDGTLAIIEKYQAKIALTHSGRDNGIYDAMNRGLKDATGDYVLFMNAGDELFSNDTIERVFKTAENADVYYGNTAVVNDIGDMLGDRRLSPPEKLNWKSLRYGMCVSHQSFIAKRLLCSYYDLNYKISADIDWVIKVLRQSDNIVNTHLYISKFLEGGTSNTRRKKALLERFSIMVKQYGFFQTVISHLIILFRYPFHRLTKKSMT
ncbi:MAG: glycosyl transferase [Bacteroidetes bacterium]|nr:glycosyl transferase [Bacteroidota bacterium]